MTGRLPCGRWSVDRSKASASGSTAQAELLVAGWRRTLASAEQKPTGREFALSSSTLLQGTALQEHSDKDVADHEENIAVARKALNKWCLPLASPNG